MFLFNILKADNPNDFIANDEGNAHPGFCRLADNACPERFGAFLRVFDQHQGLAGADNNRSKPFTEWEWLYLQSGIPFVKIRDFNMVGLRVV